MPAPESNLFIEGQADPAPTIPIISGMNKKIKFKACEAR